MRLATALLFLAAIPVTADAVSDAEVRQFVTLSDRFYASIGDTDRLEEPSAAKLATGRCVLERFESEHGRNGIGDLLELMSVLSEGVAFDDRTIVGFNEKYGPAYRDTLRQCR